MTVQAEQRVMRAQRVIPVRRDHRVCRAHQASRVLMDRRGHGVLKVRTVLEASLA